MKHLTTILVALMIAITSSAWAQSPDGKRKAVQQPATAVSRPAQPVSRTAAGRNNSTASRPSTNASRNPFVGRQTQSVTSRPCPPPIAIEGKRLDRRPEYRPTRSIVRRPVIEYREPVYRPRYEYRRHESSNLGALLVGGVVGYIAGLSEPPVVIVEKICRSCGRQYQNGANFCSVDGTQLMLLACPVCGRRITATANFCTVDGADLRAGLVANNYAGQPRPAYEDNGAYGAKEYAP